MTPSVQTFLNSFSNKFEPPLRQHLKNVYACVAMSIMAAALGSTLYFYTNFIQPGTLAGISTLGSLILCIILMSSQDRTGKSSKKRVGYLLGFAGLSGVGMGPLLDYVMMVDPSIIVTSFIATSVVFVSFSLCSLFAERGKWLYLGAPLMTLMNTIGVLVLINFFFGTAILFQIQLYLGLLLLCGYILYDTQNIIELHRMGDKDFVAHSMALVVNFLGIFRRLLIILTQKEQESQKKRRQ